MKTTTSLLALTLLLLLAAPSFAAEYYLSPTGSDATGDGSVSAPFQTLAHVEALLAAGDTVTLRAGDYVSNEFRIRYPNITIRSYEGEWARIIAPTNVEDISMCIYVDIDASHTTLSRLEIVGGYYYAVKTESTWNWGDGEPPYGATHLTIRDCKIHGSGRDAVKLVPMCDDALIERCEIYETGARENDNAEGIDNVNADRMIVRECYLHDIATTGIYAKGGATDCLIERCLIMNAGGLGVALGFDTSTEWFDAEANPNYYENIRGVLRNTVIVGTDYAGVGLYAAQDAKVYNNTVLDADRLSAQGALHFGLSWKDWDETVPHTGCVNPTVVNNIFALASGGSGGSGVDGAVVVIRYADELGGFGGLDGSADLRNNIYHDPDGAAVFEDSRLADYEGGLAGWQAHMGTDMTSIEAAPNLDAAYHLQAASPGVDAGASLETVLDDYDGNTRSGSYDIGADEYGSGESLDIPPAPGVVGIGGSGTTAPTAISDGWYYDAAQAGTGVSLEVGVSGRVYMAWYAYESSGAPRWYSAFLENQGENVYTGPLTAYTGWPLSGQVAAVASEAKGQVSLDFSTAKQAAMSWSFEEQSGSIALTHYMDDVAPGAQDGRALTGWWWDPAYPGIGWFLEAQGGSIYIACYHYREDGASRWWSAGAQAGNFLDGQTSYADIWLEWRGGQSIGGAHSVPTNANQDAFSLIVTSSTSALISWGGRTYSLERYAF